MLMRKHLGGGKLLHVRQEGLERVLFFDFEAMNELGDIVKLTLAAEIMGKYSNIILIGADGNVIDSIRRVDMNVSEKRLILPGVKYRMPPKDTERLDFRYTIEPVFGVALQAETGETSRALIKIFEGLCPLLAREWVYKATGMNNCPVAALTKEQLHALYNSIADFGGRLSRGDYTPCITIDGGNLKDFTLTEVHQYDGMCETKLFDSEDDPLKACHCLDYFYRERENITRLRQRAGDLQKLLQNTAERITGRMSAQKTELLEAHERFTLKKYGDLLSANLYRIKTGAETFTCEDFYSENPAENPADDLPTVTIALDKQLTPAKNAQKYYAEYKKAESRERILTEQIKKGETELQYIESVADALNRAKTDAEIEELRQELVSQGYIKHISNVKPRSHKPLPPLMYKAPDGTEILVGRNNVQNDMLTKNAEKTDLWLHTKNIPGSHLIIKTGGNEPSEETVRFAARLAATNSKAAKSEGVPVDVVEVRYVKKPARSKPGMVIFTNNRTIYVKPMEEE
jgi:predicted ribosome quality control (RQC) complex YloA/Tae2 family protein